MVRLPGLRTAREAALLTQTELADRVGITQPNLSKIETGGNARMSTARKLAKALKIAPAVLMDERTSQESGR